MAVHGMSTLILPQRATGVPNDLFLRHLVDDGLLTPHIKQHSLEKIRRHNFYAQRFVAAMSKRWPQLAYVGLYSGPGRARVEPTGEIVETTAMSVVRQVNPFTHYIFVDQDPECVEALSQRIALVPDSPNALVIEGDVGSVVSIVRQNLPPYGPGKGLLSFCFVDPFAANLQFDTIRRLSDLRMDFLILLMLGWDARVNFKLYKNDLSSTRIADLIDEPNWRAQYAQSRDRNVVRFLLTKFDEAMVRLGYLSTLDHVHPVKAAGTGVLQYVLVFYSKNQLGLKFWGQALARSDPQLRLL
jgi:three-Cys-motif partner protein